MNATMNADTQSILSQHHLIHFREQFPVKLYTMLELASNERQQQRQQQQQQQCTTTTQTQKTQIISPCVSWLPHGRAFKIWDEEEFMTVVVPLFFKQTKIRSFYRQLSLWGYRRITKGPDAGAWYNEFFLRGQPEEMKKMVRIKIKGKFKQINDPDFYRMPLLPSIIADNLANIESTMIAEGGGTMIMGNNIDNGIDNNMNANNCNGVVVGPSRRVTMEMQHQPAFQFNCHPTPSPPTMEQQHNRDPTTNAFLFNCQTTPNQFICQTPANHLGQQCDFTAAPQPQQPRPQNAFSQHFASPRPIASSGVPNVVPQVTPMPPPPSVVDGYNELIQRCQQENDAAQQEHQQQQQHQQHQQHMVVNPFIKQPSRLSRRSKCTLGNSALSQEDVRNRLAAGVMPLPFPSVHSTVAAAAEVAKPLEYCGGVGGAAPEVKSSTAEFKPLPPFVNNVVVSDEVVSANGDEIKNFIADGFEPLPFNQGAISTDEFASYIDNAIQML